MGKRPILGFCTFLPLFDSRLQDLDLLRPTMQSFVSPMEINVLSDGRIGMAKESRNLPDVQLLILERVREEVPQRVMRDVRNSRFLARHL